MKKEFVKDKSKLKYLYINIPLTLICAWYVWQNSDFPEIAILILILGGAGSLFYFLKQNKKVTAKSKAENIKNKNARYSKLAIAAGVLAGLGVLLGPLSSFPALILGLIAFFHIKKRHLKGKNLAIFGIAFFPLQVLLLSVLIPIMLNNPQVKNTKHGEDAVKSMTVDEKLFLKNEISKINKETSKAEVKKILGDEFNPGYVTLFSTTHKCPNKKPKCTITVTYIDDKVTDIVWFEEGRFYYSMELN